MGLHEGHRRRLIGRFLDEGLERFEPHQVLELLLFYAIPRKDTNELAHTLMNTFGSVRAVLDAPYERLLEVPGIGEHAASMIKLIPELLRVYDSEGDDGLYITSADMAARILGARFLGRREELVYALFTDATARCIGVELLHRGSVNATEVSVRALVSRAMACGAVGVLLAHNHPGGMALPSQEDVDTTLRMIAALRMVDIQLMDHLVFGGRDYVSMRQSGMWEKKEEKE